MRGENRFNLFKRVVQNGGTSGAPVVSDPLYLPSSATGDAVSDAGTLMITASGDATASCQVQVTISKCAAVEAGQAIWWTVQNWSPADTTGTITFAATLDKQTYLAMLQGSFSAIRLRSWGGQVSMEYSI